MIAEHPALTADALREALAAIVDTPRVARRGYSRAPTESLGTPAMDNAFIDRCRIAFSKLIGLDDEGMVEISSARRREGRSSVAAALALALARTRGGSGVLLLDLDFDRPAQADLFSVAPTPGLADYLEGRERLRIVSGGPARQLSLLPAGRRLGDPARLIHLLSRQGMLSVFRERFQWVVIDLPPMLTHPEVSALANRADWHILVGQHRRTTFEELRQVRELIADRKRTGFLLTADSTRIPYWIRRLL